MKELPLILKADVQGSVEVLTGLLPSLSTEKVKIRIIQALTGTDHRIGHPPRLDFERHRPRL